MHGPTTRVEVLTLDTFIPGLELNRIFYEEIVRPILDTRFPDLAYSAALMGYGSDVLGYDTALSVDHEWGPRLLLFLPDDASTGLAESIDDVLRHELPPTFLGYSTVFSAPAATGWGVRRLERLKPGEGDEVSEVNHHIKVLTVEGWVQQELNIASMSELSAGDWLTFPEYKLLEFTAGAVYYDGLGRLVPLRRELTYYPHDIWLYRLAAQWRRIGQEEAFVGRCGDVGDELGSQVIAARLVRDLMRLCFLLERRYAPYSKWLGTAFGHLACADLVGPQLSAVLAASGWQERERLLAQTYEAVAEAQNALAVTEPQDPSSRSYSGRPYRILYAERFATALSAAIQDPDLLRVIHDAGLVGAVDQWADSPDIITHAARCRQLRSLFDA